MPTPPFLIRLLAGNGGFQGRLQGPEDVLMIGMASDLRAWSIEGRLRAVWNKVQAESAFVSPKASPTEVNRARARVAKARAMGAITGSWEIWFAWSDGSGLIEAKAPAGRLSPEQRDYGEWLKLCGVKHAIVRRREELAPLLTDWGVLR